MIERKGAKALPISLDGRAERFLVLRGNSHSPMGRSRSLLAAADGCDAASIRRSPDLARRQAEREDLDDGVYRLCIPVQQRIWPGIEGDLLIEPRRWNGAPRVG
ncbi:MAG: hypothetical protein DWQ36_14710 [Acidobacteria bacterium]|nr:MAG: hypothetical protein DWQ30_03445 [Acidobacteriota bacterium]REK06143.1 MAG: hypothetical protein DWQ36_14710 [Acidobacteriota bacterium]